MNKGKLIFTRKRFEELLHELYDRDIDEEAFATRIWLNERNRKLFFMIRDLKHAKFRECERCQKIHEANVNEEGKTEIYVLQTPNGEEDVCKECYNDCNCEQ
jgi:hypothetical protein